MNTPKHKPQALLFSNCCLFFFQHAATFPPFRNFPGRLASFPPLPFLLLSSFARPSLVTECFPASDWSKKNYRHLFRPIAKKNKSQSAITIEKYERNTAVINLEIKIAFKPEVIFSGGPEYNNISWKYNGTLNSIHRGGRELVKDWLFPTIGSNSSRLEFPFTYLGNFQHIIIMADRHLRNFEDSDFIAGHSGTIKNSQIYWLYSPSWIAFDYLNCMNQSLYWPSHYLRISKTSNDEFCIL